MLESNDDRICKEHKRGEHIYFNCVNHPDKRWNTKNIGYLGARTIFYNLHNDPNMGPECDCPNSDMRHVDEYHRCIGAADTHQSDVASREEQHQRYIDCGPQAWDDEGGMP